MKAEFFSPKNRLIVALDTPNEKRAFEVLEQCYDLVDCVKLNYPLVLKEGIGIIGRIKNRYNLPIFTDFKVADVPVTNDRIVKTVSEAGADAIMVHGIVGPDALESVKKAANGNIAIVVQTELTNPGGIIFTQKIADALVELAVAMECEAVQCPGNRPDRIRKVKDLVKDDLKIVCCGVGVQGGTYKSVLESGGDFAMIGRSIYDSENPREYVLSILESNMEILGCRT